MSKIEVRCVLRAQAGTGESPSWCAEEGLLYWVDIGEPALHRFDPATGQDERWIMPTSIGCAAPAGGGRALLALRTGVARFDCGTGALEMIACAPFDPRRLTPNDGRCDPQGRFWFGPMNSLLAPKPLGDAPPAGGPLWRFDAAGRRFTAMTPSVGCSNGLAWSPDGRTMYHAATEENAVYAHDCDPDTGALGPRRKFADVEGGPDGAAVDSEGFYWCALYHAGKVIRLDPQGRVEREIDLPAKHPTMPAFGGADLRTIYVTSASGGMSPEEKRAQPMEGGLFAFEAPAPGLPTPLADAAYFQDDAPAR